jgi:hypothetical protein
LHHHASVPDRSPSAESPTATGYAANSRVSVLPIAHPLAAEFHLDGALAAAMGELIDHRIAAVHQG